MTQPWYPFYWSDYSGKTFHLTQGQHGAFFLLMRFIYTTEKPVPHELRYSIAQAVDEVSKENVDIVLRQFFEKVDEQWHNIKCETIILEANEVHESRVRAGKKRWKGKKAQLKQKMSKPLATTTTSTTNGIDLEQSKSTGVLSLPPWVPIPEWEGFIDMRKEIRKPITAKGIPLALKKLEELMLAGHDPSRVLEQSTLNSWKGLFPIGDNQLKQKGGAYGYTSNKAERAREATIRGARNAGIIP